MAGARPDSPGGRADALVAAAAVRPSRRARASRSRRRTWARLLAEAGLSFQRTRTWKASPDPDYEAKAARVLALCAQPPDRRRPVIASTRWGRSACARRAGAGWAPSGRPERQRADLQPPRTAPATCSAPTTSTPTACASGCGHAGAAATMLAFMAPDPRRYPARRRIYWIQDNLSANWTPDIRAFAAGQQDRARPDPDLRQLPQPGRVPLLRRSPSSSSTTPTTSTGTHSRYALARHVSYRNGDTATDASPPPKPDTEIAA